MPDNRINTDFWHGYKNPDALTTTPEGNFAKKGITVPTVHRHEPTYRAESGSGGAGSAIKFLVWIIGLALILSL